MWAFLKSPWNSVLKNVERHSCTLKKQPRYQWFFILLISCSFITITDKEINNVLLSMFKLSDKTKWPPSKNRKSNLGIIKEFFLLCCVSFKKVKNEDLLVQLKAIVHIFPIPPVPHCVPCYISQDNLTYLSPGTHY